MKNKGSIGAFMKIITKLKADVEESQVKGQSTNILLLTNKKIQAIVLKNRLNSFVSDRDCKKWWRVEWRYQLSQKGVGCGHPLDPGHILLNTLNLESLIVFISCV